MMWSRKQEEGILIDPLRDFVAAVLDVRVCSASSGDGAAHPAAQSLTTSYLSACHPLSRVAAVAEAEGHHPDLHLVGYNRVTAELTTHSANGLTENDFIMAVSGPCILGFVSSGQAVVVASC